MLLLRLRIARHGTNFLLTMRDNVSRDRDKISNVSRDVSPVSRFNRETRILCRKPRGYDIVNMMDFIRVCSKTIENDTYLFQMRQPLLTYLEALNLSQTLQNPSGVVSMSGKTDFKKFLKISIFFILFHFDELWAPTFVFY